MILSYNDLLHGVAGHMVYPVAPEDINASSIDVRLGRTILKEYCPIAAQGQKCVLELGSRNSPMYTEEWDLAVAPYLLKPGEFILAHTRETFDLPLNVSAEFRLKSSAARMGLSHALAVWCDPGWHGSTLTMELHNVSQFHSILLREGDKIGQMIFHQHEPVPLEHSYRARGAYNNDKQASAAKPPRSQE